MKKLIRLKEARRAACVAGGLRSGRGSFRRPKGEGSQAFGAGWEVLSPAGRKIESDG